MTDNNKSASRVTWVHFFEPVEGQTDYFFGSLKAVFADFTPEVIGCTLTALYAAKISENKAKVTDKCRIIKKVIARSSAENK
nr:MAG TPA: hypothetical protein [Caudoviricetes sp.]